MEEIVFNTVTELYQRLYPVLKTKRDDINRIFKSNIKELEIWNYFKSSVWVNSHNLTLHEMVDDILKEDETEIYYYIKSSRVEK
jgi:hypothetical protein